MNTGLPARYSGVRFSRADGRSIDFPAARHEEERPPEHVALPSKGEEQKASKESGEKRGVIDSLSGLFGNVGEDDILIAALIIVLAGEGREGNREAILLLILLLCIR